MHSKRFKTDVEVQLGVLTTEQFDMYMKKGK